MSNDFAPNTIAENTDCLVAYLPNGRLFVAKNIAGSNLRKLYEAFAGEFTRMQDKIYEVSYENDLFTTTNLIDEWERALQIPDECLGKTAPLAQRRKQIVAKFSFMHLLTEDDFGNLARFFGYSIAIDYGTTFSVFPMTFPIYFSGSPKASRFTMIITFLGLAKPRNVFTWTFSVVFDPDTNFIICLFEKLKPANVNISWRWELTP